MGSTPSIRPARFDSPAAIVTLEYQDRARWSGPLIERGRAALRRSVSLDAAAGPFRLQAAIAAEHARAPSPQATDWDAIIACYDDLLHVQPSPVVALDRAVAVAMAHGPDAGLAALAAADVPALDGYFPLAATRAELLTRAGRRGEAAAELRRARTLAPTTAERRLIDERLTALDSPPIDRSHRCGPALGAGRALTSDCRASPLRTAPPGAAPER